MNLTRREILAAALAAAAPAEIAQALQHAHRAVTAPAGFEVLKPEEAQEIEALATRIIPSDDGPGAKEAGVIHFIDRALATFDRNKRDIYQRGLPEAQQARGKLFPASAAIAALSPAGQDDVVRAIEHTPFFEALRTHTVLGFLGSPVYGGNREGAGWKYIGFEDRMSFQPPFGFYDGAEESR